MRSERGPRKFKVYRRDRPSMILDLLTICIKRGPLPTTRLMSACNLQYDRFIVIRDGLASKGLIQVAHISKSGKRTYYGITPEGREFHKRLEKIYVTIDEIWNPLNSEGVDDVGV